VGKWGFVWLAYGAAGIALLGYLVALWRRIGAAAEERAALEARPRRGAP